MSIREVVITAGDPQGIGPEVAAKAALQLCAGRPDVACVVVGDPADLTPWMPEGVEKATEESIPGVRVLSVPHGPFGEGAPPSAAGGAAALETLKAGFERVRAAPAERALATAPVSKQAITAAGIPFTGHTGWLAEQCGVSDVVMLFRADELTVALATVHVPLRSVPDALSVDGLVGTFSTLARWLRTVRGGDSSVIGVLGLNPHAGEGGLLGVEEREVIAPAIDTFNRSCEDVRVEGPLPADGYFADLARRGGVPRHDVIVALYHDQGLLPLKALAPGRAVNLSVGLPIVRTSVDHGCAWGLAGRGEADPESMRLAAEFALDTLGP